MTAEQRGLYRDLLDALWLFPDHVLPDDPAVLVKASGATAEEWARSGAVVLRWMTRTERGWTHPTALDVIHQSDRRARKQQAYRDRRHAAGNGSGNGAGNTAGNKPGSPSPSPSPSPYTVSVSKVRVPATPRNPPTPSASDTHFAAFWAAYPNKTGKKAAEKAWQKLHPSDTLTDIILAAVAQQTTWDTWTRDRGQFVPNPSTWLNQGRWDDEPVRAAPHRGTGLRPEDLIGHD